MQWHFLIHIVYSLSSLVESNDDEDRQEKESQHHVIENIHKRQNFIFSKHLMSAFPSSIQSASPQLVQNDDSESTLSRDPLMSYLSNETKVRSIKLKQQLENDSGFNDFTFSQLSQAHAPPPPQCDEKDVDLPSFSESTQEKCMGKHSADKRQPQPEQTQTQQHKRTKLNRAESKMTQMIQEELRNFSNAVPAAPKESEKYSKSNQDTDLGNSSFRIQVLNYN